MIKPNYKGSQQDFYTACRLAWKAFQNHLADFTNFKARYDEAYLKERLKEIDLAVNLKDGQARGEQSETLRLQLKDAVTACLSNWQKLKRYVADAFPENLHKPKLEAAGYGYYFLAGQNKWDSCRGLITSATNFIESNLGTLTANKNMPPGFPDQFNADKLKFETIHEQFLESEGKERIQTETKINANNELYAKLMTMCLDGQEIFKGQEAIRKQFILDQLLQLVSGNSPAGLKGLVRNIKDKSAVAGAKITILQANKIVFSSEDGRYEINHLPAGLYTILIIAEGFEPKEIVGFEIKTGTVSTLVLELMAL